MTSAVTGSLDNMSFGAGFCPLFYSVRLCTVFLLVNIMEKKELQLSEQETKIIEMVRSLDFGELRVIVNNKKPIRVEEIKKSIQL